MTNSKKQTVVLYILRACFSGNEGDIFLFNTEQEAKDAVIEYYKDYLPEYLDSEAPSPTLEELGNWVFHEGIGYWDIQTYTIDIPLPLENSKE